MDDDLDTMSREQLVAQVKRLRGGVRAHRDGTGHGLCWHHIRYRQSLDDQLPTRRGSTGPMKAGTEG